jgi:hypothetical protein
MTTRSKNRIDSNQIMFDFGNLGRGEQPTQPTFSGRAKEAELDAAETGNLDRVPSVEITEPPQVPINPIIEHVREAVRSVVDLPLAPEIPAAAVEPAPASTAEIKATAASNVFSRLPKNETFEEILEDVVRRQDLLTTDEEGRSLATYLISQNRLNEVNDDFITADVLSIQDKNGNTAVHWAAALGRLSTLPDDAASSDVQQVLNNEGKNFLHVAEACNQLKKVPELYFEEPAATQVDSKGKTVFDYANASGQIKVIPKDFLPPEYTVEKPTKTMKPKKIKDSVLTEAGDAIDKDKPETWRIPTAGLTTADLMVQDVYGRTVLDRVFAQGEGALLQPGVITEEVLMVKDKERHNMLFIIADKCHATGQEIPESVINAVTEKTLRTKTIFGGYTPAHEMAMNGQLEKMPAHAVTDWVLNMKNDRGASVIECAESHAQTIGKTFVRPVAVGNITNDMADDGWKAPTVNSPEPEMPAFARPGSSQPGYGIGM